MFKAHVTEKSKDHVKRTNTDLAVIPGGLTSVVQSLDVCLNNPIKDLIRQYWSAWIVDGEKPSPRVEICVHPPWIYCVSG